MGDDPRQITGPGISAADEHRYEEEFWAEHLGIVVAPEREAGEDTQILRGIADEKADDDEDEDTAPPVAPGAVDEGEDDEEQGHHRSVDPVRDDAGEQPGPEGIERKEKADRP